MPQLWISRSDRQDNRAWPARRGPSCYPVRHFFFVPFAPLSSRGGQVWLVLLEKRRGGRACGLAGRCLSLTHLQFPSVYIRVHPWFVVLLAPRLSRGSPSRSSRPSVKERYSSASIGVHRRLQVFRSYTRRQRRTGVGLLHSWYHPH